MKDSTGRLMRRALAPKPVVFGVAAFNFGSALSEWMQTSETYLRHNEELFLASILLAASMFLATRLVIGNLLAALLCGPLPLAHAFIFLEAAHRAETSLFSAAHFRVWAERLAEMDAAIWLASALSFAILALAIASTLRPSPKP